MVTSASSLSPAGCRAARDLLPLSQEELARLANISLVTLRRYETGGGETGSYAARQIARALSAQRIGLVGGEDKPAAD